MVSTIQVQDSTLELLKREKKNLQAESYDEVIQKKLRENVQKSMAGVLARKKFYSKAELLRGLRDETDRI